jgi:hypothetical protein
VEHPEDFDGVAFDAVRHYVAGSRDHEFARAGDATRPTEAGLICQLSDRLENARDNQTRSRRIIGRDE